MNIHRRYDYHRHERFLIFLLTGLIFWGSHTLPTLAQENKVKLLVIVNTSEPLIVDFRTSGRLARHMILFGGLDAGMSIAEASSDSKSLRKTVGKFDRFRIMKAAVDTAFSTNSRYFELDVCEDASLMRGKMNPDFDEIKSRGPHFVLVVNEAFAGLITSWKMSTLSAQSTLKYELFNMAKRKSVEKGAVSGWSTVIRGFDEAVGDRAAFIVEYGEAVRNATGTMYGQLNKEGHLHTMADAVGLGEFVPAADEILKKYSKNFDYKIDIPNGWFKIKVNSKYTTLPEPRGKDKGLFGMSFGVDLLIKEFGHESDDLKSYIAKRVNIFSNRGFVLDSVTRVDLKFNDQSIPVVLNRPNNSGKEILIFTRFGKEYVGIFSIIFIQDYELFLNKYRTDIEYIMASLSFEIH